MKALMRGLVLSSVLVACTCESRAYAQQYLLGASGELSSGVEGGGAPLALARTRIRVGGDARIDESPEDILQIGLLAELIPRSGFGADIRYARAVGEHFILDAGVLGILAPSSLYGVEVGLTYRLPMSKKTQIVFGPEADFFFLGTDLPDGVALWQIRVQGGFRVDL